MYPSSRRRLIIAICLLIGLYLVVNQPSFFVGDHTPRRVNLNQFTYTVDSQSIVNITNLFKHLTVTGTATPLLRKGFHKTGYDVKVLPYFHLRNIREQSEDVVTLTTWATYDRLDRLVELAEMGRGPISVAFHIPPDDISATPQLVHLDKLIHSYPSLSDHVDIHLVTSTDPLLHNIWRNVARTFAPTDWVMLWDIDFMPCTDYQSAFKNFLSNTDKKSRVNQLEEGKAALVIPSFEWIKDTAAELCPIDKQGLRRQYESLSLDAFETDNPVHSHATNYPQFMQETDNEPYVIEDFEFGYEVYAIYRQDIDVWCDERFAGKGFNRAACTASMYMSGMDFYVLPDQWAVHKPHKFGDTEVYSSARTDMSWKTFLIDLCHETADALSSKGLLHLEQGLRARTVCKGHGISEFNENR